MAQTGIPGRNGFARQVDIRRPISLELKTKNIGPADALSLIRCSPGEDATNGFFVSCFVKRSHPVSRKRKEITGDCMEADTPKPRKKKKKRAKVKNV